METIKLDLIPGKKMPSLHASQYDDGREHGIDLFENGVAYKLDGTETLTINERKGDDCICSLDIENTFADTNHIEFASTEQMCAVWGNNLCELVIVKGEVSIGTLNFILEVEPSPTENGIERESEINNLRRQVNEMVDDEMGDYLLKTEAEETYATITDLETLSGVVDTKASQSDLETLSGVVDTKASKTYVDNAVSPKADKTYVDTELDKKADKSNTYTKTETDSLVSPKADKTYVDSVADTKADKATTYTKTQTDNLVSPKADKSYVDTQLANKANSADVYDKTETNSLLDAKANASDVYTKTETDNKISALIDDTEASASKVYSSEKVVDLLGDKASASEVSDIRIGADGETYESAGDAVRGQIGKVDDKIDNITNWRKTEKFDGNYTHWGYDSNFKMFEDPNRETAVIPMVNGASYHINVSGIFNRFLVFTSNNLGYGYDVTRIIATTSPQSHEEYTFVNENNAKYLLITLSYGEAEFDCDLSVQETITDGTNNFNVNGISVLVSDKLNDYLATITDNNYLKDADVEYTNNCLNRGQITIDIGKLAIVTMKDDLKYIVNISGIINRFIVAGANAKTIGTTYTIIYNSGISTGEDRSLNFVYENTNNYKYLLIFYYYGTPTDPISLGIQELSYNGKMTVSGIEVALKEELPLIYDNYMSDLSVDSVATASDLYALYDTLVTAYPSYISKNVLGQDSVGNNIVEYVLTSGNYNSQTGSRTEDAEITKPKILIVTGVHGYERSSVMSTYQFVRDLCNGNPKVADLRENYIIKVIPCVTPSGFNADTRTNSNGVNINRNFADNWTQTSVGGNYSGASAADQLETQIVQAWITANNDAVLYVDFHNSGYDNEVSYIQGSNSYTGMSDIKDAYLKQTCMTSAYWKEVEQFASSLIFAYTGGEDQIASSNCYAHITGGLLSILLETSWNQNGTGKHSKMTIKTGAEALGNMLIGILKAL